MSRSSGRLGFSRASAAVIILAGLFLILYPFLADYLYAHRTEEVIASVDQQMDGVAEDEEIQMQESLRQAERYNQELAGKSLGDSARMIRSEEEYRSLLSFDAEGVMGYVSIPCIGVRIPIYHGCSERELQKGAGHLYGSSLPVGGGSTHAVITAHTGIGKARFFRGFISLCG